MILLLLDMLFKTTLGINSFFYLFLVSNRQLNRFIMIGLFIGLFILKSLLFIVVIFTIAILSIYLFKKQNNFLRYFLSMFLIFLIFINTKFNYLDMLVFIIQIVLMYFFTYKCIRFD